MPAARESIVSAVRSVDVVVGADDKPLGTIVEVSAVIGVNVCMGEIVPAAVVVVVPATRSVDVVAGSVVP